MKNLNNLVKVLEGKKTYLVATTIALLNVLVALNVISPEHLNQINLVLGALGLGALRSAVK